MEIPLHGKKLANISKYILKQVLGLMKKNRVLSQFLQIFFGILIFFITLTFKGIKYKVLDRATI